MPPEARKPPSSSFGGDFAPGQVLIGRYRIVALVGEGGMGQVYLADDLVLDQPVAVKFLPEHVAEREDGLERFRAEVRHARDVTHPNVARVHDIGEVDGRHFLTMEFVDGEDLASLIRRIGRLPREKAAEIGQQICSGLAEAHRKGVLHRDLKPANVMLDGEGRVRLTDFGLAIPADADAPMAGTPAYMAPEQLAGLPATVRSEVYSLGLLLYELYTGRRAMRGRTLDELRREHELGPVEPPSSALGDIDEAADRVIARCLARDPGERPASAIEVARALPGGDPLAAALAAGITPSPEVVAAAGSRGTLAPRTALALLVGIVLLFLARVQVQTAFAERDGVSYGKPAAVLRERSRELATELTGGVELGHEIHWYTRDQDMSAPRSLVHHSRFGPEPIVARGLSVSPSDPAPLPGSVHLALDAEGTLLLWERRLSDDDPVGDAAVPEKAWIELLEHAGVDPATLRPAPPRGPPPVFATERRAWEGASDLGAQDGLFIEAAGSAGRPVHFLVTRDGATIGDSPTPATMPGPFAWFLLAVTGLAAILAWSNVRGRRADVRGGLIVGGFAFVTHVVFVFGRPLPDDLAAFGSTLFQGMSYALHTGVNVTVFYLALEPFARRRWPSTMISWSRLLEGRFRDPAVGREVLIGTFAALVASGLGVAAALGIEAAGFGNRPPSAPVASGLEGPLHALSNLVHGSGDAVMFAGLGVLLLVLLRALVRIAWLGNGLWLSLLLGIAYAGNPDQLADVVALALMLAAFLLLLTRVGFLSAVLCLFVSATPQMHAMTLRPGDWYFTSSLVILAAFLSLAVWAYRTSVAGRSAFEPEAP